MIIDLLGAASSGPRYGAILADPPWSYRDLGHTRRITRQYPTMSVEDISALPVGSLADPKGCVLFLWATTPNLPYALEVMAAWGFSYRSMKTWDKQHMGPGHYWRIQTEHLLLGIMGKPGRAAVRDLRSIENTARGKHSVKPQWSYTNIEAMYPHARKLELFARASREGWDRWGNQA